MSRSAGTCNTMGTASTMACMAEALGTSLPHNAAIPAVDARRYVLAHLSGMRIVEMVLGRAHAVEDADPRGLRERDPRQRGDRRLDQCRHPPEGDRRPHRRAAGTGGLDPHRPGHADARRPAALGPLPDGRVLLRRRPAGRAAPPRRGRSAAPPGRADRQRQEPVGQQPRRTDLRRRGHPPAGQAADRRRRHLHPARQPGAARRGAEALGRHPGADAAPRPGRGVRRPRPLQGPHRRPRSGGRRPSRCW